MTSPIFFFYTIPRLLVQSDRAIFWEIVMQRKNGLGFTVLLAGLAVLALGFDGEPPPPAPHCKDVVPYNSIDGTSEGSACYTACTAGASKCANGSAYKTCTSSSTSITCSKGTWHQNPDGTWGCINSGGLFTVTATQATPGQPC